MKSEMREVEVFITEDGEEFFCDMDAGLWEEYLKAKKFFKQNVKVKPETLVHECYPYLVEIIKKYDNEDI